MPNKQINIYAIHRIKQHSTDYNVMFCSSKKVAERQIQIITESDNKWRKDVEEEIRSKGYPDYVCNLLKDKFRIENIKVITK